MYLMYIFYLIITLIAGGLISVFLQKPAKLSLGWFKQRAPLVKRYWIFVIPYIFINIVGYIVIFLWFNSEVTFSVFGQVSATILAIFIGYTAFSEYSESKFDKLVQLAQAASSRKEFYAARIRYEEACALKPRDTDSLGNLLEVYLMINALDKFDKNINNYMKYSIERKDKLVYLFLSTLRFLVVEHMREARSSIQETINYISSNQGARDNFFWSTHEFMQSDTYNNLGVTSKKIINNYFEYLSNRLSVQQEQIFISGNYENLQSS